MITVKFGDKDSYKDWGLILKPKKRPFPAPKTKEVSIEGRDGTLDLTTSLTGDVKYQNVSYTLEFTLMDKRENWEDKLYEISTYLHGKKMNVIFSDDSEWYCVGRVSLNELTSNKSLGVIRIDCDFEPYRLKVSETIITEEIVANKVITLSNSRKWVIPTIEAVSRNLYNYKDVDDLTEVSEDEDGWITLAYDNTDGSGEKYINYWTNTLDLKKDTNYAIVIEIKEVSGEGRFFPYSVNTKQIIEGQFVISRGMAFEYISPNDTYIYVEKTKNVPTKCGLRTFSAIPVGKSGSITFRLSVLEDTDITVDEFIYEPYIEANVNFIFEGKGFSTGGTLKTPDIILKEGDSEITLNSGEGNIRISYREGKL